jgi:hypothetical protein
MNGIPPENWLRDIAPYLLFASAPVFALDAQAAIGSRSLLRLPVAVGTLGTIAFAVQWLGRRGIAHLPISRIGVATLFVPAALFSYAISSVLSGTARRTWWLLLAVWILAMALATSNRSTLALVIAPFAIAFCARRHLTARTVRLFILAPVAVVLTLAVAESVIIATGANQEVLQKRLAIFKSTETSRRMQATTTASRSQWWPGIRSRRTRFTARGQELSSSGNPRLAASFEFHPRYIRDVPG